MEQSLSEISSMWNKILKIIEEDVGDKMVYDSFFADTYINSISNDSMVVIASSPLAVQLLSTNFKSIVDNAVREVTKSNFEITFKQLDEIKKKPTIEQKPSFFPNSRINPNFNFNNFVIGDSNREPFQASLMAAKNPGVLYNPLFIYGNSGLGKTHLLHAIGNHMKLNRPQMRVLYITAQDFFDEFVRFVKDVSHDGMNLRDYFAESVDVLLVDDIQFLVGREKTEEFFFTVFNTLSQVGKQIVITSDQHPSNLNGLSERLKTRFSSGLPISISKPDERTCESILKAKIEANGLSIDKFDKGAITYFAKKFGSNVRELEGALNKLLFYTINIDPKDYVDLETAMNAVSDLTNIKDDKNKFSVDRVIKEVSEYYKIPNYALIGKSRLAPITLARHIAMYLCSTVLGINLTKIGEAFGGKDHSSVLHAVKKIGEDVKNDPQTAKAISDLTEKLKK